MLLGQLAEGKHCFTSSKSHHTARKGSEATREPTKRLDFTKKNPWTTAIDVRPRRSSVGDEEEANSPSRINDFGTVDLENEHVQYKGYKKRSHQVVGNSERQGMETEQNYFSDSDNDEADNQSDDHTSSRSGTAGSSRGRGRKRKDIKSVPPVEESLSEFVSFRKEQAAAKEMVKKQGLEFSVTRCLAVLKDMDDVSDEIKIGAADIFKDALNREIFLGYESRLRGLWLRKEVSKLGDQST